MVVLFNPGLWRRINDHFRTDGSLYVDAPRPRAYAKKERLMFEAFPAQADVVRQAAFLAKNLVNLQRYPDANKRTASVLLEVFLQSNGRRLACSEAEYGSFLVAVQRKVPPTQWDGRTFSLRPEYIPWQDDEYHAWIEEWLRANTVRKP